DTTLGEFPLPPRADRFCGFAVSNSCALANADASDGTVHVPVGPAGSSLELEGHCKASYSAWMSRSVKSLRAPSMREKGYCRTYPSIVRRLTRNFSATSSRV